MFREIYFAKLHEEMLRNFGRRRRRRRLVFRRFKRKYYDKSREMCRAPSCKYIARDVSRETCFVRYVLQVCAQPNGNGRLRDIEKLNCRMLERGSADRRRRFKTNNYSCRRMIKFR